MTPERFANAVEAELASANEKHPGTEDLPDDGWFNPGARRTWESIARLSYERAKHDGRLTFAHIFDEESAEVLAASAAGDVEGLKKELIQVSAMCLKWLRAIERRGQ